MADSNEPTGKASNDDPCAVDEHDEHDVDRVHDPVDVIAARLERLILDHAATWEETFAPSPGQVVSVKDAARVVARELASDAHHRYLTNEVQVRLYQRMVDQLVDMVTALGAACEKLVYPPRATTATSQGPATILRYLIPVGGDWRTITLAGPIVHVASRMYSDVEFWAINDPEIAETTREYRVFDTGEEIPDGVDAHHGTALIGGYVHHLLSRPVQETSNA